MPTAISVFDFKLLLWVQENVRTPILSAFFIPFTTIGNAGFLFIFIGVVLSFFKKTRRAGLTLLISLALSFILNDLTVKNIIQRARPYNSYSQIIPLVPPPGKYSFPSGHTAAAFSSMVTLFFTKKKYAIPGLILAVIMGLSRIYVGVHYPSDVLCGAILGSVVAVIVSLTVKKAYKER